MKCNLLYRTIPAIVFSLLVSTGYTLDGDNPSIYQAETCTEDIVKSPNDRNEYRYLKLDNGIRVVLVSYPDTEVASVAIAVNAGSHQEPDEWPGLAHLLEHTLFLGSEKYPDPSDFESYIENHGGQSNAWTDDGETVYYFSVNQNHLFPALDRLSQFFISPRLDPDWVDKERHAVDSEFQIYRQDDKWQQLLVDRATINQKHPSSRFTIGTLDTLKDHNGLSLQKALREFHQQWYVSKNMAVVLVSNHSLDEMAEQVSKLMGKIPQKASPGHTPEPPVYTAREKGKRIDMQTDVQSKSLQLIFPLTPDPDYQHNKSSYYIAYLLGHEGAGSLHTLLMKKNWIQGLFSAPSNNRYNAAFFLGMELTDEGYQHIEEIVSLVFDEIQLIKSRGINKRFFLEQKKEMDLAFHFMERSEPQATALRIIGKIFEWQPRDIIRSDYLHGSFSPVKIQNILTEMKPETLIIKVSSNKPLPVPESEIKIEPWMGMRYSVRPLTEKQFNRYRDPAIEEGLDLPPPNTFLPDKLTLNREQEQDKPERQEDFSSFNVWSRHDQSFAVPKTFVRVRLYDQKKMTLQEQMQANMFTQVLYDELAEPLYMAALGDLSIEFEKDDKGAVFTMSGYTEKMPLLLNTVLDAITSTNIKSDVLERNRELLRESLEDDDYADPSHQLLNAFFQLTSDYVFSRQEMLKTLSEISVDSLQKWSNRVLSGDGAMVLINGNASKAERTKLLQTLSSYMTPGTDADIAIDTPRFIREQPEQNTCHVSYQNDDSALLIVQNGTNRDFKTRAQYYLLSYLISAPFYSRLRTEEQLGYQVSAFSVSNGDHYPALVFIIQSPEHGPEHLDERTTAFFQSYQKELNNLSSKTLDELKTSLMAEILDSAKNLDGQSEKFWNNLEQGFTDFDGAKQLARAIKEVTPEQIQSLFQKVVHNRYLLKIYGYGQQKPDHRLMMCEAPTFIEQALMPRTTIESSLENSLRQ